MLSDLVEGVPPAFLQDWLVGYFINPACFWLAYQARRSLVGRLSLLRLSPVCRKLLH